MSYRNPKLKQAARNEQCVACGAHNGSTVWAHSNSQKHGKGTGIKAHDLFGAFLCYHCHTEYDSGTSMNRQEKQEWFREQWERSMIVACEKGYI